MNRSERIVRDRQEQEIRDINHGISSHPLGGGGSSSGRSIDPIGVGNFAGWGMSAGIIGAVLGGIAGQGFGGAIFGGLLFAGGLWVLAFLGKRSGAWHPQARPLLWLLAGAAVGCAIGAATSFAARVPFPDAVTNWAIFTGGLAGSYCWICRFMARRAETK